MNLFGTRVAVAASFVGMALVAGATASASSEPGGGTATWARLSPVTSPAPRGYGAMSFDDKTGQLILYGGVRPNGLSGSTWVWDGSDWSELHPAAAPSPRMGAAMAYDPATGQVLLFGGYAPQPGKVGFLAGTWAWNGTSWSRLQPTSSPPPLTGAAMAYDPATRQIVLVGGLGVDGVVSTTWAWDGSDWSELKPTTSPPAFYDASLGYYAGPGAGQLILFGGIGDTNDKQVYLSGTWAWDGSDWVRLHPQSAPTQRSGAPMAYDPATRQLVLFGGFSMSNGAPRFAAGTWAWDGSSWERLRPSTNPPARANAAMTYDSTTKELMLFGGSALSGDLSGTWVYASSSVPTTTTTTPQTTSTVAPTSSTTTTAPSTSTPSQGTTTPGTTTAPTTKQPKRRSQAQFPGLLIVARNATGDGRVYRGVSAQVLDRIMAQRHWLGRAVLLVRSQAVVVVVVGAKH